MSQDSTQDEATTPEAAAPHPRPEGGPAPFSRRALFGGEGEVKIWNLLPAPAQCEPFRAALWCELEPGGSVGAHRQEHFPELIICVAGEGVIQVGARATHFRPGSAVYLPLGSVLQLRNQSDQRPLSYWIIKAAAAPEVNQT